jgi:hypothetical protein
MARRVHFRPTMAKIFATLEHVYAAFAQMYANSKPIRWHRDLDAAIHSAGLDYGEVTRDWLTALNHKWVYAESNEPFSDPERNRTYRRFLST